ncbi:hypothetical protein CUROG_02415 [Corynebacterium urogenitale]|uniref:Uncharacterized protein n=1 Tax=Corynebacterium urogenitale TaxID=2487892 RepID=A0A5J6Z4L7_9CORY|nr:hypothetical protein [Corynebacterium urogenitale]QFQ01874.1 hypothetical protein CUROG_02415 [Corynebacterium urogenitale]
MTALTANGQWIIGSKDPHYIPVDGIPSGNLIPTLLGKKYSVTPRIDVEDEDLEAALQRYYSYRDEGLDVDQARIKAISSLPDDLRDSAATVINGSVFLERENDLRRQFHKRALELLNITPEDLERFPYKVDSPYDSETPEAWTEHLATSMLLPLLIDAKFRDSDDIFPAGNEAIRQWRRTIQADPAIEDLSLEDFLKRK